MPLSNSPCVSNAVCNEVIASKVSVVTDFGSDKGGKGKVLGVGPETEMSANMMGRSMRCEAGVKVTLDSCACGNCGKTRMPTESES